MPSSLPASGCASASPCAPHDAGLRVEAKAAAARALPCAARFKTVPAGSAAKH